MDILYGSLLALLFLIILYTFFNIQKKHFLQIEQKLNFAQNRELTPTSKLLYSFQDAFDNQKMLSSIQDTALENLNHELSLGFRDLNIGETYDIVNSVKTLNDNRIVMTLSKRGQKLLKSNQAELIFEKNTGKLLPTIRNTKSKKFIEQMKGTPAKSINKLTWIIHKNSCFI